MALNLRVLTMLLCGMVFFSHAASSVDNQANAISDASKNMTGSKSSLNTNVIGPLSGGGSLKTFDGNDAFSFEIGMCDASETFMKVLTQPQSSGKLRIIAIEQDTTLDGSLDRYINMNIDADMICSNGIMTCSNVDDFSTCSSYKWSATTDRMIGLSRVGMTELGGCYCISGRCGSSLAWNNLDQVLTDVAGGISAELAQVNPYYTMAGVEVNGTQAIVKGGNAQCDTASVNSMVSADDPDTLTNYHSNSSSMESNAASRSDNSWMYQTLQDGSLNPQETSELRQCSEVRLPGIDSALLSDVITLDSGSGSVGYCGPDCIQMTLGRIGDNYWSGNCTNYELSSRFYVKRPDRIESATLVRAVWDDWIQISADGNYIWSGPYNNWALGQPIPGRCELSTSWDRTLNVDFTEHLMTEGVVDFLVKVNVTGNGEGYALAKIQADLACRDTQIDTFTNSCRAYQADPDCTLVEETVDGVTTFNSGAITGLTPLPQSKNMSQDSCQITITRPWFEKRRTYRCEVRTQSDLTKMIARSEEIKTTTTPEDYQDIRFVGGTTVRDSGTLDFGQVPTVQPCVKACKVRTPVYPDVTIEGVDVRVVEPSHYDVSYKECGIVTDACALEGNEELVQGCQCVDDFAEATAIMQVMRQAGQDMICSSGIEQSL